jgi:hypothetical protein
MDEQTKDTTPTEDKPVQKKALVATGQRQLGFTVTDVDQAWRIAGIALEAGWLPDKWNQKMGCAAIMHGAGLGMNPMAAVQRICIINGRPSVWGDAVPAIAISTGQLEDWKESITGEGDAMVATCTVKRRGIRTPMTATFSMADAKTAGLLGKGTWKQYPRRMLTMRARVAFRDLFADAFVGLYIAEEVQDIVDLPRKEWQTVDNPMSNNPKVSTSGQPKRNGRREPEPEPVIDQPLTEPASEPVENLDMDRLRYWSTVDGPLATRGVPPEGGKEITEDEYWALVEAPGEPQDTPEPQAPTVPKDAPDPHEPPREPPPPENAPATAKSEPEPEPGEAYYHLVMDTVAKSTQADVLNEWWRGQKLIRQEHAKAGRLSATQLSTMIEAYKAKHAELLGGA